MSLARHGSRCTPHAVDNEHINMYKPTQVNARRALQFHGPVSGWSVSRLWFAFIRRRKKNIVMNYWTDAWVTLWLMKQETGGGKKRKNKNCYSEVDWCQRQLQGFRGWCWRILTRNMATGAVGVWTKLLKLHFSALFYPFPGDPSEVKSYLDSFESKSWYPFDRWTHLFCFSHHCSGKTNRVLKQIK